MMGHRSGRTRRDEGRVSLLRPSRMVAISTAIVLALGASGCKPRRASSGKPKVAVSIFPLYDAARRIAGDRLDVVLVLPAGRSEHSYDPTPREMAQLADARLAVAVGLEMDEWLERIVRNAGGSATRVLQLGPVVNPRSITHEDVGEEAADQARDALRADGGSVEEHHEHEPGAKDPHFWLDPERMIRASDALVGAFAQIDPGGAAGFRERQTTFATQLRVLDAQIMQRANAWSRHTIVTFHGSMGYYAARYHLSIAAVIEPFPGREPTPRYLAEVLEAMRTSNAAALFCEPQLDRHPAQVISEQSHVPLYEVDPVGGTPGRDTYERLLQSNTDAFERALR